MEEGRDAEVDKIIAKQASKMKYPDEEPNGIRPQPSTEKELK